MTTRTTVLSSWPEGPAFDALVEGLAAEGEPPVVHPLRQERFAPCKGCWGCWVEHPGQCGIRDAANSVMQDMILADRLVFATGTRFGSWDPVTKAALDRSIGLVAPFFQKVHGETHHRARYAKYPRWAVLVRPDRPLSADEREGMAFLVARNVVNLHSVAPWVGFLDDPDPTPAAVHAQVRAAIRGLQEDHAPFPAHQPFSPTQPAVGVPPADGRPRHALVWVGSAKPPGTSTSEALGAALARRLEARGWTTEQLLVHRAVKLRREGAPKLVDAVRRADLVVLASPIYVDTLPSLVLAGLGHLVDAGDLGSVAWLPILQCGFPEVEHTTVALQVVERAVRDGGWAWAGHLAMGGGEMLHGRSPDDVGGPVLAQVQALDAAAEALSAGSPVPAAVSQQFAQRGMSPALYRLAGTVGWLYEATKRGGLWHISDQPFIDRR